MKLTYDTLLHTISISRDVKDTVQLMATCQVLYYEGPKIALKKPVVISTAKQLTLFLMFLHAGSSFRCRYLRKLELKQFFMEEDVLQGLIQTIPLLTNIKYLQLAEVEELLELHPALTPAFCSLTTLQHIVFAGVGNKTCELLHGLHAPLISANVEFLSNDDLNDDWEQYHPTTLLNNFAPTLEELHWPCIAWQKNEVLIPKQVYPNMRKLSIELPVRIDPFIRAFPNLTHLHIETDCYDVDNEDLEDIHTTNVAQQCGINSCGTWAHLEHFYGSLVGLYGIGIISHIPRVTLEDRLDNCPQTPGMLAKTLRCARPLHLKIDCITSTLLGNADQGFIPMLRDATASNLINLNVRICFVVVDRKKDPRVVVDTLSSVLSGLPLKFLELGFITGYLNPTPQDLSVLACLIRYRQGLPAPPAPLPVPFSPVELSLQCLDMDALIARLEAMPALQAAHVLVHSSRSEGDYAWKGHERTIAKGTSRLAGGEQWESWTRGKNEFV